MMTIQKIKSVIVEDELAAREVLKNYLSKYCPQVEVVGEAQNIKEAVPLLHEIRPQLVFLDVEMPFGNAFDVLEACKDLQFETIFVTAFSEYSLKALNQSAAYYLLKPISIEELIVAVNKVQHQIMNHEIFNRNKIIVENFHESKPEKQQVILPTLYTLSKPPPALPDLISFALTPTYSPTIRFKHSPSQNRIISPYPYFHLTLSSTLYLSH
jgi:two-component system LytT family response regulator